MATDCFIIVRGKFQPKGFFSCSSEKDLLQIMMFDDKPEVQKH